MGLQMGKFQHIRYRVMALDLSKKLVFTLYLWHFFTDFLQTLHES